MMKKFKRVDWALVPCWSNDKVDVYVGNANVNEFVEIEMAEDAGTDDEKIITAHISPEVALEIAMELIKAARRVVVTEKVLQKEGA